MKRRKRLKSWQRDRLKVLIILLVMVVVVGWLPARRISMSIDIRDEINTIRMAGHPTTIEELDALKESVPEEANAAPLYLEAVTTYDTAYISIPSETLELLPLSGNEPVDPGIVSDEAAWSAITTFLDLNAQTLTTLHQAATYPECRYPTEYRQGSGTWPTALERLPNLTRLLCLEAMVSTHHQDTAATEKALASAMAVTRSVQSERNSWSYATRGECVRTIVTTLAWCLSRSNFDDDTLRRISKTFFELDDSENVRPALIVDRAYILISLEDSLHGSRDVVDIILGTIEQLTISILGAHAELMEAADLPRHEGLLAMSETMERLNEDFMYPLFSAFWKPSLEPFANLEAQAAMGGSILAIQRYQLKNGNIPAKLSDLVPEYLEAAPVDPYDGQPLRYDTQGSGYQLYSVGKNRKDDEAHPKKDIAVFVGNPVKLREH